MVMVHYTKFDTEAVSSGLQETNSPVFASLIDTMGKKPNWVILDLGPARAANLELLSGVDVSALPPDSDLIIIFRNQYGSTYRQFPFSGCPEGAWLNDSGICELVPL